jgi:hypothetical protein
MSGITVTDVAVAPSGVGHTVAIREWIVVKQPDGRFARFSGVVDAFTDAGLDRWEAVECLVGDWRIRPDVAEHRVRAAVLDSGDAFGSVGSGLDRWRAALTALVASHGEEWARGHLEDIGFGEWPLPAPAPGMPEDRPEGDRDG